MVYKRRLRLSQQQVTESFARNLPLPVSSQIGDEIAYFRAYYGSLLPVVFLSYEREAYYSVDGSDFRVTFDEEILYRQTELSLDSAAYGTPILEEGQTLMELKTAGAIPLWMTHVLTGNGIYKTSFSKYGAAYRQIAKSQLPGGKRYA